jgi:hypothetical protein
MSRKNGNVGRKTRLDRRPKGERRAKMKEMPRVPVEDMVLPDGQCRFQSPRKAKARFATKEKAAKALVQAQHQRARTGSLHVEKRYYKCPDGGCGGYHLTSRDEFDEKIWRERRALHEKRMNDA